MDDPGSVRNAQGRRDLNGDVEGLTRGEPGRGEPSPEGLSLDVLHSDVVLAFARLIERIDRADVRMIEGGRGAGFLLEAENASAITREVRRKKLQRDLAPKPQLGREPHLTHASGADEGDDFVRAEPCARLEGHVLADYTRARLGRSAERRRLVWRSLGEPIRWPKARIERSMSPPGAFRTGTSVGAAARYEHELLGTGRPHVPWLQVRWSLADGER
jgi:hypothetical protein